MQPIVNERNGFHGIWPALLTPLREDLSIDHAKWVAHAHQLLQAGCSGVTPFGTTGEGPSFSVTERQAALEALLEGGVPAERILVSTSCAAVSDTLALTRHALARGVHGILIMPPFFFKGVSEQGVIDAYRHVIEGTQRRDWRLYLYHIPQVCAVPLPHGAIRALMQRYPGLIAGIKDSAGDAAHSLGLTQAFMPPLTIYVGHEPDLPALGRQGSTGAISGLANFVPRLVRRLVLEPDGPQAARDLARVRELLALLAPYALLPALKGVMAALEGDAAWLRVRPPLVMLSEEQQTALAEALRAFGVDTLCD